MKKNILTIIPWVIIGVLITLLITQKACPGGVNQVKINLEKELQPIKTGIALSAQREKDLLARQTNLETENKKLLQQLSPIQSSISKLEKKLAGRPAPENPKDFKTLPECQEKYDTLKESYTLCLDLDNSRKDQLKLFSQVYQNLTTQKTLLEGAVDSLHNQVNKYIDIEKSITTGMEKLDKAYRTRNFWKDMKKISLGVSIGIGATVITTAVIRILKAIKK